MKALKEFVHASGSYKPGDEVKVKNEALLNKWKSHGLIGESIPVTEVVEKKKKSEV